MHSFKNEATLLLHKCTYEDSAFMRVNSSLVYHKMSIMKTIYSDRRRPSRSRDRDKRRSRSKDRKDKVILR